MLHSYGLLTKVFFHFINHIFPIISGRCIRTLKGHSNTINGIHRDGIRIVSASDDKTLKITDFHPHSKLKIVSTDVYNDVSNSTTLVRNVK